MPDTQSKEKIDTLVMLGADVRPVPAVPFSDSRNYNHQVAIPDPSPRIMRILLV